MSSLPLFLLLVILLLVGYVILQRQKNGRLEHLNAELQRSRESTMQYADGVVARESAIAQVVAEALVVVNPAREVVYLNDSARDIFRGTSSIGRRFAEVAWGFDLSEMLANALEGKIEAIEQTVVHDQRAYLARARPIGARAEYGAVVVLQDVTELQRLGRARRDFVANISHELRTPLASVKLLVETLLKDGRQDSKIEADLLKKIDAEVDALKQLSDELFDLAQIESGQAPLRLTSVNVPVLVDRTMARFGLMAERRQIVLVVGQVEKVDALVDADKFDKVLGNLVHNAIKFTPPGGCVTINAHAVDDMIEIRVQDTGLGIPAQDLPRIFERFYKVDRMRARGEKGTGLGLAIARHIVEAHGGKIGVESVEGAGAIFHFTIPRA